MTDESEGRSTDKRLLDWLPITISIIALVGSLFSGAFALGGKATLFFTDLQKVSALLEQGEHAFVPIGSIVAFSGDSKSLPLNFIACDGRKLNKGDYRELWLTIGDIWGAASAEEFVIPDLRGQFLRGVSGESDKDPDRDARFALNGGRSGNSVGSFQRASIAQHGHSFLFNNKSEGGGGPTPRGTGTKVNDGLVAGVVGANVSSESRPPNAYVIFAIRAY